MRYVETVSHREMRNNSGEILRRVGAGESISVTNNGQVAALIVPPISDVLEELIRRGQLRPARRELGTLRAIPRSRARQTSGQLISDSRGRW